ncbi:MAG: NlpC/P60 family protein [Marinilabiliaceae bacterium]
MKRSICAYAMIPVRSTPAEGAEMVTQILFGEMYDVFETVGRWARIQTVDDSYPGWIDAKLVTDVSDEEIERWTNGNWYVMHKTCNVIEGAGKSIVGDYGEIPTDGVPIVIPMGSSICDCDIHGGETTIMFEFSLNHDGYAQFCRKDNFHIRPKTPVECAKELIGAPYLWGGRTVFGIDCSGLVQIAYKVCYVKLPRDASQMVKLGTYVTIGEQKENDLAFFANESGHITHVGLCMDGGRIIHASGSVRIDTLDSQGIYNKGRKCYTHKLACIKRLWNDNLQEQIKLHEPPHGTHEVFQR